ncbi:cold shock domain-containing protein [Schaedlerella arabinosiphila]|jgi:CspA family cold shock protein|uniref:Cold shock domain-containing protein n=1 Tax=Schaedlerella arabinosiphila TaxID=2044587 RepID=A0A426DSK5_9FIRM|nr:cold shock domain-containing protein [Schaedlerella arabinosiphila]RRK36899.1 cold shock domain-containing protein [Schaedlerella arabinosiphila]
MHGTVKWFSVRKGYGFLTGEDGEDYFVHYSNIVMDGFKILKAGQEVTFQLKEDDGNRSQAVDVKRWL